MCSSYGFAYLLEPIFSTKLPQHKQLFCDAVHLNQRGLAILLKRIVSFLSRSQHKQANDDLVKITSKVAVMLMPVNRIQLSRRMQDPHKHCHKINHKDGHQSHQPHSPVNKNRTQYLLASPLSTGDILAAHHCGTVLLL